MSTFPRQTMMISALLLVSVASVQGLDFDLHQARETSRHHHHHVRMRGLLDNLPSREPVQNLVKSASSNLADLVDLGISTQDTSHFFGSLQTDQDGILFQVNGEGRPADDTCDFCGSTGSCGRAQRELGDSYKVTVTGDGDDAVFFVTCRAREFDVADCLYGPNNESPTRIPDEVDLFNGYLECPDLFLGGCNYIYPRYRASAAPEWESDKCTDSACEMIERVAVGMTAEFSCPVGSFMVILGAGMRTLRTNNDGGIFAAGTEDCGGSRSEISCNAETSIVIASADDCSCFTCSGNSGNLGKCNVPVVQGWVQEGFCINMEKEEFCDESSTPSPTPSSQGTPSPTPRPDACDKEVDRLNECASNGCNVCLVKAFEDLLERDSVTCGLLQDEMCDAIYEDCKPCDGCREEAEDFFECIALEGGCSSFECTKETPSPRVTDTPTTSPIVTETPTDTPTQRTTNAPPPTASPTDSPTKKPTPPFQCKNDKEWAIIGRNGKEKGCQWVRANPEKRCNKKDDNNRKAFEACPRACGNTKAWRSKVKRQNNKPANCNWVKNKPGKRCGLRDENGVPAFKACAVACCKYNKKRWERKKQQQTAFGGEDEEYDNDEDYDEEEEDYYEEEEEEEYDEEYEKEDASGSANIFD